MIKLIQLTKPLWGVIPKSIISQLCSQVPLNCVCINRSCDHSLWETHPWIISHQIRLIQFFSFLQLLILQSKRLNTFIAPLHAFFSKPSFTVIKNGKKGKSRLEHERD